MEQGNALIYTHKETFGNHLLIMSKLEESRDVRNSKSGDMTSPGENVFNIRTYASPTMGQDHVSGGVSVSSRQVRPIADALWKPMLETYIVKTGNNSNVEKDHESM